jgi:hypothetical protein
MITGLKGVGDFQCLETLQDQNLAFDRATEDKENLAAAKRLGIRGMFKDWTWENWMSIEIERGLIPQCYACLLLDPSAYGFSNGATIASDDPRLLIGMSEGYALETYVLSELGGETTSYGYEGIYWRVGAAFAYPDFTLNAPETLDAVKFLVGEWNGYDINGDGQFSTLTISKALRTFERWGGYVDMTGSEKLEDLRFQAIAVTYLMIESSAPGMFRQGTENLYRNAMTSCELEYDEYASFGHCVADKVNI